MNVIVQVSPSAELARLFDQAKLLPAETLQAVSKGLAAAGPIIVGNAVKDRFTALPGPFPISEHKLGRKSGRLRQSITNSPPQIKEGSMEVTMRFGSNVSYFAIHEFGFTGAVNVRAHQRKGKPVRAHSRNVNIAARAPMTTELQAARTSDIVVEQVTRRMKLIFDNIAQ